MSNKIFAKNLYSKAEVEVHPADRYTLRIMNHDYWFERDGHVCLLTKASVKKFSIYNAYVMYQIGDQIYDSTWTNSYEYLKNMYKE